MFAVIVINLIVVNRHRPISEEDDLTIAEEMVRKAYPATNRGKYISRASKKNGGIICQQTGEFDS